jgi:hypothetical protein
MRLPQSLAASEDDPSSPQVSASTIRRNLLETPFVPAEQLAQSIEIENRESVPHWHHGTGRSGTRSRSWFKSVAVGCDQRFISDLRSADTADQRPLFVINS